MGHPYLQWDHQAHRVVSRIWQYGHLEPYRLEPIPDPKGHESKWIRALFLFPKQLQNQQRNSPDKFERDEHWETSRDEVRTMTVLFSELLVPGWAQTGSKIGLGAVTGAYGTEIAFALPCHTSDPELFFSENPQEINLAKSLCAACPALSECLAAALSRQEPCGVWGGELFEDGSIISRRRAVGRPRLSPALVEIAEFCAQEETQFVTEEVAEFSAA